MNRATIVVKKISKLKREIEALENNKVLRFRLPKNLNYFLEIIKVSYLVELEFQEEQVVSKKDHGKFFQVAGILKISALNPKRLIFDLNKIRSKMYQTLLSFDKLCFIDFEMTLLPLRKIKSPQQIIQFGYVLTDQNKKVLAKKTEFVKSSLEIDKKTTEFLTLDLEQYKKTAITFKNFYNQLKKLKETGTKFVVWGNFDYPCLVANIKFHQLPNFFEKTDFVDLSRLHKDYFVLKNDVSLFNAYKTYFEKEPGKKTHDALMDSVVLMEVYFKFFNYISIQSNNL